MPGEIPLYENRKKTEILALLLKLKPNISVTYNNTFTAMLGSKKPKPVVFNVLQGVAPPFGLNKKRQILVPTDLPTSAYPDLREPPQVTKSFVDTRPPPLVSPPLQSSSLTLPISSPYGAPAPPISSPYGSPPPPISSPYGQPQYQQQQQQDDWSSQGTPSYGSPPPPIITPPSGGRGVLHNSRGTGPPPLSSPSTREQPPPPTGSPNSRPMPMIPLGGSANTQGGDLPEWKRKLMEKKAGN